jgi:PAS domain S-box-containing protein
MSSEPAKQHHERLLRELHRTEEVFRLLVSGVKDYAIFMLDPAGNVMTWNEGAERIKGYKPNEIIGKHFSKFYTAESNAIGHPQKELELALKNGSYEEEGWRVRKDGSTFWASIVITPIYDKKKLTGFAKITRDLTEKRESEERTKEAIRKEAIFRSMVSGVKDYAIFMLDPTGHVMTWNEGAQRIKGYKPEEIIGKHFSVFYTEEAKAIKHPQYELEIALKEGSYEEEGWRIRKDGSTFWASVVITPIYDDNELLGFAKVTRDLTERRQGEQEREAANAELRNALEVKTRFLSTISHEVRTPMSGIIGMTELLSMQDFGPDSNEIVSSIFEASKRLLTLLNDLLDSARMESGKLSLEYRTYPIRAVLGDVRALVAPETTKKKLALIVQCDDDVPESVCGDEFRIRQVLLNLAFNAAKFTHTGSITVRCSIKERKGDIFILRFSVEDTGIGISAKTRERLFIAFEQGQESTSRLYGGSGLGLSICKSLVELMGGEIGVDSELGKGATFWFELPFNSTMCSV